MHQFEVWAPNAGKVAVELNGKSVSMLGPDEHGQWSLNVDDAGSGADYGYLLDDDAKVYPDPRSRWQPQGVHNRSRVYDQSAFIWTDDAFQPKPLASGIIYELHIGTFTEECTLDAAIAKLDHLVNLGVTHIELMPVAAFAGDRGWGYDGVALFAVHEIYGGPDALKRFVDAAHRRGSRCYSTWYTTTSVRWEITPASSVRISSIPITPPGVGRSISTAPVRTRSGAFSVTTPSCGCGTFILTVCASMRFTRCSTALQFTSSSS
jgi:hypothetical protein